VLNLVRDADRTDERFAGKRHHYRLNKATVGQLRAALGGTGER
jgi:hypothetical protein